MSNFPTSFDDDTTLPVVNDNIDEIGGQAINAVRDFAFNTEQYLGLGLNGTQPSLAARLGVSINPDGTINPSAIASLGLVTLPITQDQIANNAGIPESKLMLDYRTGDLFNYIRDLSKDVNNALGWISTTGIQLEPHLLGAIYRHSLDQIDVSHDLINFPFLQNKFRLLRDNSQSYNLINDINNELLAHQWADGSPFGVNQNVVTNDGSVYPSYYGHTASGIFLNTSRFDTIPQTAQDLQLFAEFIDQSSIFLLGTRIQNLYANGISVTSTSSSLTIDGYGQSVVPPTTATAFLRFPSGNNSAPVDDIDHGDDIIQFFPSASSISSNSFDQQFALVQVGDIIRINYGTVEVQFVILEKKYIHGTYAVRIAGKNLFYTTNAIARIDRPLFNKNKYGVLAVASANSSFNSSNIPASLIIGAPRGAQTLGIGFNPDQFDNQHYLLYLALYPTGSPQDGYTILPAIDVTGNRGATPGSYTLDSIVQATNLAFRQPGYNYRFIAFSYQGEFGIMLADSYNNASFSIINATVLPNGTGYDTNNTNLNFPHNVVDVFTTNHDPLGFGISNSNIASPPYSSSFTSSAASQFVTRIVVPLRRNNYYVDGVEKEKLNLQVGQALDQYGDGYWVASIDGYQSLAGHLQTTYLVPLDLSNSDLKVGKTLVVQSLGSGSLVDFGRFVISGINFNCSTSPATAITVYDAVHATGVSPSSTLATNPDGYGSDVALYFNSDSVAFSQESATDLVIPSPNGPFKRFFEIYVDEDGNTFTHERARLNASGTLVTVNPSTPSAVPLYNTSSSLSFINIYDVSPKLRGYNFGITKINLQLFSYDSTTGLFDGYLCQFNGTNVTNAGPIIVGQKGLISRFYDDTNVDYIDFIFNPSDTIPSFTSTQSVDIQLFPSLSLDGQIMQIGTCQFNTSNYQVFYMQDKRQFGNISEDQLSTSAIDFIQSTGKELFDNGIIRGFDALDANGNPSTQINISGGTISFSGGEAFVNGKIIQLNPQTIDLPVVLEAVNGTTSSTVNVITWFICVNDKSEIELVASTDFDPFGPFVSQYSAFGLNHLRLFYVLNPNMGSPVPYQVRGTYFAGLVVNQKDVTPIAVAVATVTNPGSGFVVSNVILNDAKRFITNGYGGLVEPMTLGTFASFRNFDSLINWLYQLNNLFSASVGESNPISNTVIVKGHVTIVAPVTLGYIFGEIHFEGDNGVFDVFCPTGFEIQSNVHFNNVIFNYLYDPVVYDSIYHDIGDGYYSTGDLINTGRGLIHMGTGTVPGSLGFNRNVAITNCHFIWVPLIAGLGGVPPFVAVPPITSTAINRYSFINVELAQPSGSAPTILQSVNISNNTFIENTLNSFAPANQETTRAAIAFVSTSKVSTLNIAGNGLKLINVVIRDNVCDKDQMIAIVPSYATSAPTTIANTFNATSVLIENNTCGAISVFTQYDTPVDVNFTANFINFTLDKNNGLIIKGNTCKYITSTDSKGVELFAQAAALLPNTGPIIIEDNTCSWIKLPLNVNPSVPAAMPCIIKNNVLKGYDTNFRKNYLNGILGVLTNTAIELIIIGTSLSTSAVIDSNWIDIGAYATISPIVTFFPYDLGISTAHDAEISHNTISNLSTVVSGQPPIGIELVTSGGVTVHSNIHHNKLFRLSTTWQAYINAGIGGNHLISDNFFDQTTVDGTHTEQQIIGSLNLHSIFRNVNQLVYEAISLVDYKNYYIGAGAGAASGTGPAATGTLIFADPVNNTFLSRYTSSFAVTSTSVYSQFAELAGFPNATPPTTAERDLSFTIPLSDHLPSGVRIMGVQMGVWLQIGGSALVDTTSTSNNAITLSLVASKDNLFTGTSGTAPITDVKNNIIPSSIGSTVGADFSISPSFLVNPLAFTLLVGTSDSSGPGYQVVTTADLTGNTQFLTLTPTPGVGFTTGNNYRINLQVDMNFLRRNAAGSGGDGVFWYFSPILVTYTW